eukprot:1368778-Pleurochrysis_carterae.AAC.2
MCQGPGVQQQVAEAIIKAASAKKKAIIDNAEAADVSLTCEGWCSEAHSNSHCSDARCNTCSFCENLQTIAIEGCDQWCRKEHGHCTDSRCLNCQFCADIKPCKAQDARDMKVESCEHWCREPYKQDHCTKCACKTCGFCTGETETLLPTTSDAPAVVNPAVKVPTYKPQPAVTSAGPEENLECYALRYPDILSGFCHGDLGKCAWTDIKMHWEKAGVGEGRDLDCSGPDVTCYVLRYRDLMEIFCGGQLDKCAWKEVLKHWALHGHRNGLTFGCKAPDTICYANKYPDLLAGYCKGNANRCDWVGLLTHWAQIGEQEMRDFSCA